jgi:hypothetical protein
MIGLEDIDLDDTIKALTGIPDGNESADDDIPDNVG